MSVRAGKLADTVRMTGALDLHELDSPDGLTLFHAIGWRRWHSSPGSRSRLMGGLFALVVLVPLHVALAIMAGQWWSLAAIPANPAAFYLLLRGWAYRDVLTYAVGFLIAFVGNFLPFYLPRL